MFVQAAAMTNESAAQELANRLTKSGLSPFVQRTETSDGVRFRVRLGPFASRGDAERSRARLRAMGVHSNIVGA
ncbi:MAG TPA: SPOR domain-containing protein [Burkholderiaceae bacterium]|nr:SPOR domain-containing protein [Burkholderiaceae bacterium]